MTYLVCGGFCGESGIFVILIDIQRVKLAGGIALLLRGGVCVVRDRIKSNRSKIE